MGVDGEEEARDQLLNPQPYSWWFENYGSLKMLNTELPYGPAIPLLSIYPKERR